MRSTLGQYALATFLLQIYYFRFFDLKTYVLHLLNFSIQGPYYFLLIFIQLKLITPLLISWCDFCNKQQKSMGWHIGTVAFLCWVSSVLIRYTFMLPVHGGGKYLLGGTYLLLYYLGILLENFNCFQYGVNRRCTILLCSSVLWIFGWQMLYRGKTAFLDQRVEKYWGIGFNPPSIQGISFGLITLFLLYALFTLLEELDFRWINCIMSVFAFLGRNTLYTFMYHLLVRDFVRNTFPVIQTNVWILRICVFIPMLTFPALGATIIQKLRSYIQDTLTPKGIDIQGSR